MLVHDGCSGLCIPATAMLALARQQGSLTVREHAVQVEYASAGQLADKCRSPMPEDQARGLFSQLLEGLAYCHSKGVYHRDLRSELIFLSGRCGSPSHHHVARPPVF